MHKCLQAQLTVGHTSRGTLRGTSRGLMAPGLTDRIRRGPLPEIYATKGRSRGYPGPKYPAAR